MERGAAVSDRGYNQAIESGRRNLQMGRSRPPGLRQPIRGRSSTMSHVTYAIVEHDGGWAYKVGDVYSETFPTREAAHEAAARAAGEQRLRGEGGPIEYEDSSGQWHEEEESGDDRPDTEVKD
jgi:Uncharacterized protein conserved in bacteria (DUF2188)